MENKLVSKITTRCPSCHFQTLSINEHGEINELMEWDSAFDLLEILGQGAILEVVASRITIKPKKKGQFRVEVKIVKPQQHSPIRSENPYFSIDCVSTDSCKVSTEEIKP